MFESPFRGSEALAAGHLTRGRLRGPAFRRLFEDVYVGTDVPVDLALRSRAAHLLVAGRGVLAGSRRHEAEQLPAKGSGRA